MRESKRERERCAWTSIEMASNGIIKSLTNVEGVGFGSERRATLQFYFDRRISFVKHAVQRITIIISPPYVFEEEGGGVRTCTHSPISPCPDVNVDRIPFLQIILPLRGFERARCLPSFFFLQAAET